MIDAAARKLVGGARGEDVVRDLRQRYGTLGSMNTKLSHVRKHILDNNLRPDEYDTHELLACAVDPLVALEVAAFLSAPLRKQVEMKPTLLEGDWPAPAKKALERLKLLPAGWKQLTLSKEDTLTLRQQHEAAVVKKNETLLTISEPKALLKWCEELLQNAKSSWPYPRIILPLLLVSGRRTVEVTNGRSSFTACEDHPMGAYFVGAAKKRGSGGEVFKIPLLINTQTFNRAMLVLREKQGASKGTLTNVNATNRYAKNLHRAVREVLPMLPACHPHTLRSIYLSMVFHCFSVDVTMQRLAMRVFGHNCIHESLAYRLTAMSCEMRLDRSRDQQVFRNHE